MTLGFSRLVLASALIGAALVAPRAEANRFRDNPEHVVDRASAPWTSPIGELQSKNVETKANGDEAAVVGSGFLVSPCYIMTAAHVPHGDELSPGFREDHSMLFRAGISQSSAFAGRTIATPIISGNRDAAGRGDWALMKLSVCVGRRPEFGWFDTGQIRLNEALNKQVNALGFDGSAERGTLSMGEGKVLGSDERSDLFETDAVMLPGQSGGPVFTIENGTLVVSGMNVAEKGNAHGATYDHYSSDNANLIIDVTRILTMPYIKALLDADKAEFGQPNPAAERLRMDHLPQ